MACDRGCGIIDVVCDLSHHTSDPDYAAAAAAGTKAVFYKATQGTVDGDPTFAVAEGKARAAGLWWGGYHFGTGDDGVVQADHFLSRIPHPDKTLLALDFEPNPHGTSMTLAQAHDFVTRVHDRTGRWPGFYSGHTIREALGNRPDPILANCWFWLAQYGPVAVVPSCWPTWTFWQYTDGVVNAPPTTVPGFGRCDRDRFNGDAGRLAALWPH